MEAEQVARVRAAARAEGLLSVNNTAGAATVVVELAVTAAIVTGLTVVDRWGLAFWALQVAAGVSIFRWFVILHECGHRSLFSRRQVNSIVGHLASIPCLIPYFCWRDVHQQHHRWVGVIDKDPTQAHLLKLRDASTIQNTLFRIVWRAWLPIPFAQFLWKVFWGYPRQVAGRGDGAARRGWMSIGVVVAAHAAIITVVGWRTWLACFVPMLVVFYVIIENFNLPQHSGLFPYLSDTHPQPVPFGEQDAITRSSHLPDTMSTLLALNFNRHVEHHIFPSAPWYALNRLRRVMADTGYRNPHEVPFMSYMLTVRRQDPLTIYRDALPLPAGDTERTPA
jgi:acyl-lipid omega-6 desaturase (Delta-12 desaturase)